jgi:hypothetical protein
VGSALLAGKRVTGVHPSVMEEKVSVLAISAGDGGSPHHLESTRDQRRAAVGSRWTYMTSAASTSGRYSAVVSFASSNSPPSCS